MPYTPVEQFCPVSATHGRGLQWRTTAASGCINNRILHLFWGAPAYLAGDSSTLMSITGVPSKASMGVTLMPCSSTERTRTG